MIIKAGTCAWLALLPTSAEAKAEAADPPQSIRLSCFVLLTPELCLGWQDGRAERGEEKCEMPSP